MESVKLGLKIRKYFPIYANTPSGLCYLDTAASSQKPSVVIDRVMHYYSNEYANIHRGAYRLSAESTELYEAARRKVSSFINAPSERSIIFTKNATESINLVANAYGNLLHEGDTVLLTQLEHHSNIVPWQLLSGRKKINIQFVKINHDATIDIKDLGSKLQTFKPKLLAITAHSNAFGVVTPLDKIMTMAADSGTKVLVDASQGVVHGGIDISLLNPDFLVFTGHKLYGPTGVGVLYGKLALLEEMNPFLGGGDMIEQVTMECSTWAEVPRRFEAGTPAIAEVIGLSAAIEFVESIGVSKIKKFEQELFAQALELLLKEDGVTLYGPCNPDVHSSIISLNVNGVHPHDLSTIADSFNVQIRSGHHCAMPAMRALGLHGTARASIGLYSDISDFERLIEAIRRAKKLFSK